MKKETRNLNLELTVSELVSLEHILMFRINDLEARFEADASDYTAAELKEAKELLKKVRG